MQTNVDFPPKTESFSSAFGSYILHICVVREKWWNIKNAQKVT
jgi:hypothetical protein